MKTKRNAKNKKRKINKGKKEQGISTTILHVNIEMLQLNIFENMKN